MIDSKPVVSVEPSWHDTHESRCLKMAGCSLFFRNKPEADTPCLGSVEYCRTHHKWAACDPYPSWLDWGRKIVRDGNPGDGYFYKPTAAPKQFESKIYRCPPSGRWVASEPVNFVQEFRAYVLHGRVIANHAYLGTEDAAPAFPWADKLPQGLCAAVDYGYVADGRLLPVEVGDPYACGWYGSLTEHVQYSRFVLDGWRYMLKNSEK